MRRSRIADGVGDVTLRYRVDPSAGTTDVPMTDDGTGADLTPGDGIFSASIPGQSGGALVTFEVLAEDADAAPASSMFPPQGGCLIRFGDLAAGATFATYRMWITQASLNEWDSQPYRSNDPFPITFVYNGARAIYGAGAYYGGNKDSNSDPLSGVGLVRRHTAGRRRFPRG